MNPLATLQAQHEEISRLLLETFNTVRGHRLRHDPAPLALAVGRLVKLLREHLAVEDVWLYPAMMATGDKAIAALAKRMHSAMGSLADEVEEFYRLWQSSAAMHDDFERFRADALALLRKVDHRIASEDEELLPVALKLDFGPRATAA